MSVKRIQSTRSKPQRWAVFLVFNFAGSAVNGFQTLHRTNSPVLAPSILPGSTRSHETVFHSVLQSSFTDSQDANEDSSLSMPFQNEIPSSSSQLQESFSERDSLPSPSTIDQGSGNTVEWYEQEEIQEKRKQRQLWLERTTDSLISTEPGSLIKGKWHELSSMLTAWSSYTKSNAEAPLKMEAILKRLHEERRAGNEEAIADIEMYNRLIDAWACAALFKTQADPMVASQRAREILVLLQETYEQQGAEELMPDAQSFNLVLHVVCRIEGPTIARRLLAFMEYLHRSGKNTNAKPTQKDYTSVLLAYTKPQFQRGNLKQKENAGALVEGFLRHMNATGITPTTYHYNLAIKAWTQSKRGREAAEHADRILEDMQSPKDIITYSSVISAWAASGMRAHAVQRVEELLRQIENDPHLEPNTIVLNAVMSAWVKSRSPGATDRTEELLLEMEKSAEPSIKPDLISYNTHLHALSLETKKPGVPQRADALLSKMEKLYDSGDVSFAPNLFSYNLVIETWAKSRAPDAAMKAAHVLRKLAKRPGVEPETFSFNQVLLALSRQGSAKMAEELLSYMDKAYRSGVHPNAKPEVLSYIHVIHAYTRSGEPGAAVKAERLLRHVSERSVEDKKEVQPNRDMYNAVIDCWAKSGQGTLGARKAESLLQEMQELREKHDDESMAPNLITFNCLLNAWALSGTRCCGYKAEYYLDKMWELYNAGDNHLVKPNDKTYNTVIKAISKSKNGAKAQKALRILRRMDKLYRTGVNKEARPNEVTYTAVLNSCAFPAVWDDLTRRKALDTAIFTLAELKASRYGHPNTITYGTYFKALANLLPDDDQLRRAVIKEAFQQCCKDGQVGEMVLTHLRAAAPADLYDELVVEVVREKSVRNFKKRVTVADLPREWRSNVRLAGSREWRAPPRRKKVGHKKSRSTWQLRQNRQ